MEAVKSSGSLSTIMKKSFRVSKTTSAKNTDLDYRPAPVMSDYDVDTITNTKSRSLNKNTTWNKEKKQSKKHNASDDRPAPVMSDYDVAVDNTNKSRYLNTNATEDKEKKESKKFKGFSCLPVPVMSDYDVDINPNKSSCLNTDVTEDKEKEKINKPEGFDYLSAPVRSDYDVDIDTIKSSCLNTDATHNNEKEESKKLESFMEYEILGDLGDGVAESLSSNDTESNSNDSLIKVEEPELRNWDSSRPYKRINADSLQDDYGDSLTDSKEGILPTKMPKLEPDTLSYTPRFQFACPDIADESLPYELRLLFKPLYCELCKLQMTSFGMSRVHYQSKKHKKKVKLWLTWYAKKSGTPLHPRATASVHDKPRENYTKDFYCLTCNIPLTGKLDADVHYMGQKHQRKLLLETKLSYESKPVPVKSDTKSPQLVCEICSVHTNDKRTMMQHLKGGRHAKKMKKLGLVKTEDASSTLELKNEKDLVTGEDSVAEYRTPSGEYYCDVCKMTVNSLVQFKQHQESKNHQKKAGQLKDQNSQ